MISMAPKGHFLTQMPHPMHRSSEMYATFEVPDTSMHILPTFTTGHVFLHSCLHFFGLHRSAETMAMRESESPASSGAFFPFLPILSFVLSLSHRKSAVTTRARLDTPAPVSCAGRGRVNVPQEKPWRLTRICRDPIIDLEIMTGFHLVCVSNAIRFPVVVQ